MRLEAKSGHIEARGQSTTEAVLIGSHSEMRSTSTQIHSPPFFFCIMPFSSSSYIVSSIPSFTHHSLTTPLPLCLILQSRLILLTDGSVQRRPRAPLSVPLISIHRQQKAGHTSSDQYMQTHTHTHTHTHTKVLYVYILQTNTVWVNANTCRVDAQPCGHWLGTLSSVCRCV